MAVNDTYNEPSADEAEELDTAVYRRRRLALGAALLLGFVSIAVFAAFGYQAFNDRLEAARKLDKATVLIEDADALVVETDDVVRAPVTPELAETARGAAERVSDADALLADAIDLIDEALPDLTDDERERGALLRDCAQTRRAMLEVAPQILAMNAEAASAIPLAEEGWESLLEADKLSDKAVNSYNKLTKSGVSESQRLNKRVSSLLSNARTRFEAAEKAFSDAPFEQYLGYVDTRLRLNKLSLESDKSWLDGKLVEANSVIGAYNQADRKSVTQAKGLPPTPSAAIAAAYEESVKEATETYMAARQRAVEADQRLKDY